jgi:hypothetical protein
MHVLYDVHRVPLFPGTAEMHAYADTNYHLGRPPRPVATDWAQVVLMGLGRLYFL